MGDTRSRGAELESEFWPAEEELRARVRQQEATGRLGLAALSGMDPSGLIEEAVHAVAGVLDVEYCKILELMPDGATLLLRAGVGWREGLVGTATVGTNLQSQAGYALISPGPVVVEDLRKENRFEDIDLLQEHGVVSGLRAPRSTSAGAPTAS
jgi:GAF domain-containing protein